MKIKTKDWAVFYKKDGEWKGPWGDTLTKEYMRKEYGSVKKAMKAYRKHAHRRLKLKRMVWV